MTNVNILLFIDQEISSAPTNWAKISSFEAIRETLCEIYPEQSDKLKRLNNLYQVKKEVSSLDQLQELHNDLQSIFGMNALGVNQTSGSLIEFDELSADLSAFEFFLNSLIAYHFDEETVQTAGAGLIGLPDIQFKEDALEISGTWVGDIFEWLQSQPDIEKRPYIEWEDLGKFRLAPVDGWEIDDPYYNPAGMLKLIRSL